jgi:hypothetical protein
VDTIFLKAHAERCRLLAENADEFCSKSSLTQSSVLGDGDHGLNPARREMNHADFRALSPFQVFPFWG